MEHSSTENIAVPIEKVVFHNILLAAIEKKKRVSRQPVNSTYDRLGLVDDLHGKSASALSGTEVIERFRCPIKAESLSRDRSFFFFPFSFLSFVWEGLIHGSRKAFEVAAFFVSIGLPHEDHGAIFPIP